jgi:hypothetical protein
MERKAQERQAWNRIEANARKLDRELEIDRKRKKFLPEIAEINEKLARIRGANQTLRLTARLAHIHKETGNIEEYERLTRWIQENS